ncbi:MAG: DNA-binding protein YbiB [Burkholderiales bacterium]|nr:DNA-binding protein YbiB [Burkholderiales bacterium]
MNFTPIIKEVGRGARGARGLDAATAREAFTALLDGAVNDIQLGAWWLAMRIKGETPDELAAFVDAMQDRLSFRVDSGGAPVAVLPCYNGARQLPNLTPLLAWALAQRGVGTLLHGVRHDPSRVTTAELFAALGFPVAETGTDAERALTSNRFVLTPIDALHPKLATLLANRWRIGVRSTPHTVVKLLQPLAGPQLRVVALTHGDYIERMATHLTERGGASGVVFRGCEGEPVLHPKRPVQVRICRKGETLMREWQGVAEHDLPDTCDIAATVAYIESVIHGQRTLPPWIEWLAREVQAATHEHTAPAG